MLINRSLISKYSPYPLNYDLTEVMNYVDVAEKIWILPIIGQPLYEELQEQVDENQVSEKNATLLTQALYPYLGFAVAFEALPLTWAEISETGVQKGKSDNSDSLTLKEMTYVSDHLRRQVEARKDFLIKWLCERSDHFPLICGCDCECSSCCGQTQGKLNSPNKLQQLYTTNRKCTDLK